MNNMYKLLCIRSPDHHLKFCIVRSVMSTVKKSVFPTVQVPRQHRENRWQIVTALQFLVVNVIKI